VQDLPATRDSRKAWATEQVGFLVYGTWLCSRTPSVVLLGSIPLNTQAILQCAPADVGKGGSDGDITLQWLKAGTLESDLNSNLGLTSQGL
jgi:hypothetical protein